MLAQIDTAHFGIIDDLGRGAFEQDLARMDDGGPVNDVQGLADIVVGDQNADARAFR